MRVLVLGSSGQIGAPLCKYLRSKGHKVVEWDIEKNKYSEDLRRVENMPSLAKQIRKADFVFFLAYDVGGSTYLANKQSKTAFMDSNLAIMNNVFLQLENADTPFIFASSQMSNMSHSPYGVLKRLGEFYTKATGRGVVVKFWNVYGPEHNEEKFHVISDFIRMARDDGQILCRTTGEEKRNFLHVDDCSVMLEAVMNNHQAALRGEVVKDPYYRPTNAAGEVDIFAANGWASIRMVAELVGREMGVPVFFGVQTDEVQGVDNTPHEQPLANFLGPAYYRCIYLEDGIKKIIKEMCRG